MSILASGFLSAYLSILLAFSFVTHPINYCLLLLSSALVISLYSYVVMGFSWYLALFCLVYVGGVYVLFVFVSLHNPNPSPYFGGGKSLFFFLFFWLWCVFVIVGFEIDAFFFESSHYLCSFFEGFSYGIFCLVLMVGFAVISVVSGDKASFCR